ncbi:hypothetical protein L1049_026150 [Liquidambar formosana]|uniref:Uncharacterized protein n=1 Tax=Liquidambar formosana TaxID=63359 RepID=A0AAP0R718_LIQFO
MQYYYHLQSNLMFRSLVEVDIFKMYGIIPKRSCKPKKVKAEEYFESLDSTSTGKIRSKEKETLPSPNNPNKLKEGASSLPSKETKLIAEAFLKESYDNLMNWSDGKPKAPHGNKKRNMGEEIIEEEREQTTISTSNSAETQDDELIEAPVDFDFSSF